MTVFMNWTCWTYIVIGRDLASAGLIENLDFPNRLVTYKRATPNVFAENPFPLGSPEYDRFFYDTISAKYDHIWVNPRKQTSLDSADYDMVHALKKPPSFVELIDIDPRDYFGSKVEVVSTAVSTRLLRTILSNSTKDPKK